METMPTADSTDSLSSHEKLKHSLWKKIGTYAQKAGLPLIYGVLLLFYSLQDEKVPKSAKLIIGGALAYFILPIDTIPDFIPLTGFTDDLGMIVLALTQVAIYLTPETKAKAKAKLTHWFPEADLSLIATIDKYIGQETPQKEDAQS